MKNLYILIVLTLTLSGCASINSRGHYVDDKQISTIKTFKSTKKDIIDNLGTPNIISDYNKNTWYYVSRSMKDGNIKKPETLSQRILIIEFDNKDLVIKFKVLDAKKVPEISISSDKTPVDGANQGAIIQYVKNIGKFNSKSNKKKR